MIQIITFPAVGYAHEGCNTISPARTHTTAGILGENMDSLNAHPYLPVALQQH